MGNSVAWNNFHILAHNNIQDQERNLLKETQLELKNIKNGDLTEEIARTLPEVMLKSVVKSLMEELPTIDNLCRDIQWTISSSEISDEEGIMNEAPWLNDYITNLKLQNDFLKAYIFKEENKINIWIVIEETGLDFNLKYLKLYRECQHNKEFSMILFEKEEEEEIMEQISYITKDYEEVTRYGD